MSDEERRFSLSNILPTTMFEEGELELVAGGGDFIAEGEVSDEPEDYLSEENLELYRYLCQKDD